MTAPGHLLLEVFQARPIGRDPFAVKLDLMGAYIISGVQEELYSMFGDIVELYTAK